MPKATVRRGEVIFHDGDPAEALHLVARRRVTIPMTTALGDVATIAFTYAGDVVGEQAMVPPAAPRAATVVAIEPTETMALCASDFAALRASTHRSTACYSRCSSDRHRARCSVAEALLVGAETRVLRRLLDVAAAYESENDGNVVVLAQEELAGWRERPAKRSIASCPERSSRGCSRSRVVGSP